MVVMSGTAAIHPPSRPHLAFRVGVTGARKPAGAIEALRPRVEEVLRQVRTEIEHLAGDQDVRAAYVNAGQFGEVEPWLTVISPLAEGADRLVAEVGLALDYRLHAPLPFTKDEYKQDFADTPGGAAAFDALLEKANAGVLELDGSRDDCARRLWHQSRSYEAVGRYVVHNCDLLIAIWDGKPPRGRGGTSDIVRHALETGVPIWWIDTMDPASEPMWLQDVAEPRFDPANRSAPTELTQYIKQLVKPPAPPHAHPHGVIEWLVHLLPRHRPPPHLAYLTGDRLHARWWCGAHARLLTIAAAYRPPRSEQSSPDLPIAQYWHLFYRQAGAVSGQVGDRYRSTYVWVFALLTLSLMLAALGVAFVPLPCFRVAAHLLALPEALVLATILVLIVCNIYHDWHQRWIDTRLLAELFRKQQALGVIGWSLPGRALSRLVEQQHGTHEQERAAWVPWFFAAVLRSAPLPTGVVSAAFLAEPLRMARKDLIEVQQAYHANRGKQYRRAARSLVIGGEVLFLIVGYLVYLKVCHAIAHSSEGPSFASASIEFLALALPTIGAAFVGIRAYAELLLLAEQSKHMEQVMKQSEASLAKLATRLDEPLASQDLGAILHAVTTNMLQDVDGWARMFRVKAIDAG